MLASQEHGYIYIRNPRETFDWEIYTKPLTINAWMGLLLFGLVVPILLLIPMYDCKLVYLNGVEGPTFKSDSIIDVNS